MCFGRFLHLKVLSLLCWHFRLAAQQREVAPAAWQRWCVPEQLVGPGGTVVVVTGGDVVGVTGRVVVVPQISGFGTQWPSKPPGAVVVPVSWQVQAALQSLSTPVRHGWF